MFDTRRVPLHVRCRPFTGHDFSSRSNGRSTCPYSLSPDFRTKLHRVARFERIDLDYLTLNHLFVYSAAISRNYLSLNFLRVCYSGEYVQLKIIGKCSVSP